MQLGLVISRLAFLGDNSNSTTTTTTRSNGRAKMRGAPSSKRNHQHIPYRSSKLTHLLMDALGGASVAAVIAHISPCRADRDETINTLRYASRACRITNKVVTNEVELAFFPEGGGFQSGSNGGSGSTGGHSGHFGSVSMGAAQAMKRRSRMMAAEAAAAESKLATEIAELRTRLSSAESATRAKGEALAAAAYQLRSTEARADRLQERVDLATLEQTLAQLDQTPAQALSQLDR